MASLLWVEFIERECVLSVGGFLSISGFFTRHYSGYGRTCRVFGPCLSMHPWCAGAVSISPRPQQVVAADLLIPSRIRIVARDMDGATFDQSALYPAY